MTAELNTAQRLIVAEQLAGDALAENERLREDLAYAIADAKRWHDGWQELGRIYTADVDALRVERDSLRGVVQAARDECSSFGAHTFTVNGRLVVEVSAILAALAAAADAPQPEPAKVTPVTPNLSTAAVTHQSWCSLARTSRGPCDCRTSGAAQPADPPTKETQR